MQYYMALWLDWAVCILYSAYGMDFQYTILYGSVVGQGCMHTIQCIQYGLTVYNTIWLCGWTGLYALHTTQ